MNLNEAKNVASLLAPEDARQVLLALYSAEDDMPEMTPPAFMAYALLSGGIRTALSEITAGQKNNADNISRIAAKPIKNETNDAARPEWVNYTLFDEPYNMLIMPEDGGRVGAAGDKTLQERRFDEFWAAYPRKVGKEAARKVWRRIKPSSELQIKILDNIKTYRGSDQWLRDNGQFIPYPSTWLNQGRWDDEPPPQRSKINGNRTSNIGNFDQRDYSAVFLEQFVTNEFGNCK